MVKKYILLLKLAREAILSSLEHSELKVKDEIKKKFSDRKACFVTLTIKKELRGCIGSLSARQELYKDVIDNARNAAFSDPRFNSLTKEELKKVKIEISVLSGKVLLGKGKEVVDQIDKKMGIILEKGVHGATFLPQVWGQLKNKKDFLEALSTKAGLYHEAWKEAYLWYYLVESVEEK